MTANPPNETVLAVDLGGTKTIAALVSGREVLEKTEYATDRDSGPDRWIGELAEAAGQWDGRYVAIGVAVTGRVSGGNWSPLNRATLDLPEKFPLVEQLQSRTGQPIYAVNDAQAAAWGEYLAGTSSGQSMVFLTISTGLGGGIVEDGRLVVGRDGLAGHFGQMISVDGSLKGPVEDHVAGRWMTREAGRLGHCADAIAIFDAAGKGDAWAETIVSVSATRTALLCLNIQLMLDPDHIVIGGGIGLADGYLQRVERHCGDTAADYQPNFRPASLGKDAGIVGVADLALKNIHQNTGRTL